jgi:hypothetical protein
LSGDIDIGKHMLNLINALTNLSPSRNIISQLVLLIPKDLATIEQSYPETSSPEAKEFLEMCLGVEFRDVVKRSDASFAEFLYIHIHKLFDWLDDEGVRSCLAKLAGVHINSINNPYAEWAKLVLKKFSSRPNGDKILSFLKMLLERNSFIVDREGYSRGAYRPDWQPFLNEARNRIKANPAEFEEILKFTVKMPGGTEHIGTESLYSSRTDVYLEHSEYHLDLILSKQTRLATSFGSYYDHFYELRHKNTVKELLKEVCV